jgi:hypothetical protein
MSHRRTLSALAALALAALAVQAPAQRQRPSSAPAELEEIPEPKPLATDVVHLDNGDQISGSILRLDGRTLVVAGDLVEGEARLPLEHVALALFRTPEQVPELPGDRLVFPNGDRLSVRVNRVKDGSLVAATGSGQPLEVKTERLTGIVFEREPYACYENDFESDDLKGLKPISGKWAIEKGCLVQKERNAAFSNVALPVTQDGRFLYEWTALLSSGYTYGLYFFAQDADSVHGDTSYLILAQGRSIYLYKVLNSNQQYYASYEMPNRTNRTTFQLDYNPADGHIILRVNGTDAFRYRDPQPILTGRYVILRVDSLGSFDDVTIKRLGGGRLLATEAKARGRDIVCLTNNDEVAGTVLGMDEATVLMKTDYDADPVDVERRYVSSVTFYRQAATLPGDGELRVTLINGDVITGRLVGLDAENLVVETAVLGQLKLARTLVRNLGTGRVEAEAVGAVPAEGQNEERIVIRDAKGEVRVVRRAAGRQMLDEQPQDPDADQWGQGF